MENEFDIMDALQTNFDENIFLTNLPDVSIFTNPFVKNTTINFSNSVFSSIKSVIIQGESISGKSHVLNVILPHFIPNDSTFFENIMSAITIQNVFSNANTKQNDDSTRNCRMISIQNQNNLPKGCRISSFALERQRVSEMFSDGAFHMFTAVLSNDELRNQFALQSFDLPRNPKYAWNDFQTACLQLDIQTLELKNILNVVIACLFLHVRDFASAATLLHIDTSRLTAVLCSKIVDGESVPCSSEEVKDRCKKIAIDLYDKTFKYVVNLCNSKLESKTNCEQFHILETFGFQYMPYNGFEQLCQNYVDERLHKLFIDDLIVNQQLEYNNEGVVWTQIIPAHFDSNSRTVELIESFILPSICKLHEEETVESFICDMSSQRPFALSFPIVRNTNNMFCIDHYSGKVTYSAELFAEHDLCELPDEIHATMLSSSNESIRELFQHDNAHKHTIATITNEQMKDILKQLLTGKRHYIRCVRSNDTGESNMFDKAVVKSQISRCSIFQVCEMLNNQYDIKMSNSEYNKRFAAYLNGASDLTLHKASMRGLTTTYLSTEHQQKLIQINAYYIILNAFQKFKTYSRMTRVIQRAMRTKIECRKTREITEKAKLIQRTFRKYLNFESRVYRERSELERLRSHVDTLTTLLKERDNWIFRAKLLLLSHSK